MAGSKNKNVGTPGASNSQMPVAATGSVGTNEQVGVLRLNEVNNLGTDRDSIDALPDQGRIYAGKDANGVTINLRSLTAGNGIAIDETPSTIRISVDSVLDGVISGARNTNTTGTGVYKDPPDGSNLIFRRLQGTAGIAVGLTPDSLGVTIGLANPDAFGDIFGATNIGVSPSVGLYVNKTVGKLNFRSLASGSGKITLALGSSGRQIDLDINEVLINVGNTSGILPASRVSGLAAVATSGSYVDLNNKPTLYSRIQDQLDYAGTAGENQLLRFAAGKWSPFTFVQQNAFAKVIVGSATITAGVPASELRFDSTTVTLSAVPATGVVGINLTPSGVTAGSFVNAGITVDTYGRVTAATTGTPSYIDPLTTPGDLLFRNSGNLTTRFPVGTPGQVLASTGSQPVWQTVPASVASLAFAKGTGITVTGSSTTGAVTATAQLDNTSVVPGTYAAATVVVDAQGRLTSATAGEPFVPGRKINTGTGLTGGGDLSADRTIILANTTVAAGSYTAATITVDAQGRITAATSTPVVLSSRKIDTGTGLTGGGDLTVDRTIILANTSVTAGMYTAASITVDAQGRITAATNTPVVMSSRKILTNAGIVGGGDLTADRTLGLEMILTAVEAGAAQYPSQITVDRYGRVTNIQNGAQPLTSDQFSLKGDLVFGYPEENGFLTLSIDPDSDIGKFLQVSTSGVPEWEVIPGPTMGYTATGDIVVGDYITNTTIAKKTRRRRIPIGTTAQMLKVGSEGFPVWESNPSFVSLSSDPTSAQLPAGTYNVFKNTTTGRIATWVNDAGTLRSSTIYAP